MATILEAKEQIKNAIIAYRTKDQFGNYLISVEKQRPIVLMGPPGIGKTAIMQQIASELNLGLVAYSMTHHTRQSALGLPFITKKSYGGKEYEVSEYTMSEIIASVYDMIEATGHKEGILFLDEINCVSETLSPAMLQFLQYKVFGRHSVPDGWIIVTAGNPPEYNNSVHEFDIVTWDRLKRIDVDPDYAAWREYAIQKATHPAVISYLDIKKVEFYHIETTVDGKKFVTARGWSDLSEMIKLYEMNGLKVDKRLIEQYLQNDKTARDFAVSYDLFVKYRSDYQIDEILNGKASESICQRAESARFDERIALLGMLMDRLNGETKSAVCNEMKLLGMKSDLESLKRSLPAGGKGEVLSALASIVKKRADELAKGKKAGSLSEEAQYALQSMIADYEKISGEIASKGSGMAKADFDLVKAYFNNEIVDRFKKQVGRVEFYLDNAFTFVEKVFKKGTEMTVFVTDITVSSYTATFLSHFGCRKYYDNNKALIMGERFKGVAEQVAMPELDID